MLKGVRGGLEDVIPLSGASVIDIREVELQSE
jgi:hypothetical protein